MGERVLCTFPGKFGDLLWALPTMRAISRRVGAPVDLLIPDQFRGIVPLLQEQPYLGQVLHDGAWEVQDTAPISPRVPPFLESLQARWDRIYNLGYREWPTPDVVRHTLATANLEDGLYHQWIAGGLLQLTEADLDLQTPWITCLRPLMPREGLAIGFTDEHFELKYGLYKLLQGKVGKPCLRVGYSPRWTQEGGAPHLSWDRSAQWLAQSEVFLGCCSALHVLAVALGTPVVLMEPNPHRHNDVFYPLGKVGPQVTLVVGTDGQPTWDSRHVFDTVNRFMGAPAGA